ncbi:MAG: hypothetical protein ACT4O1_15925 [Gemmatimonadota bacterium]
MALTKRMRTFVLALALGILSAAPLLAQSPTPGAPADAAPKLPVPEPKLVFDREVFGYPGVGRRDPFKPLVGKESLGPLFDDLRLRGIIYSTDPMRSIVLIQDGSKRQYRLKRGDVVGNSRVVEIRPLAVRFAVENFGMIRQEVLEIRRGVADATGMPAGAATPATGPMPQGQLSSEAAARRLLDSIMSARRDTVARTNSNDEPEARR